MWTKNRQTHQAAAMVDSSPLPAQSEASAVSAALAVCLDWSHATAAPGLYLTSFHMLFMTGFKHRFSCAAPELQPIVQC